MRRTQKFTSLNLLPTQNILVPEEAADFNNNLNLKKVDKGA